MKKGQIFIKWVALLGLNNGLTNVFTLSNTPILRYFKLSSCLYIKPVHLYARFCSATEKYATEPTTMRSLRGSTQQYCLCQPLQQYPCSIWCHVNYSLFSSLRHANFFHYITPVSPLSSVFYIQIFIFIDKHIWSHLSTFHFLTTFKYCTVLLNQILYQKRSSVRNSDPMEKCQTSQPTLCRSKGATRAIKNRIFPVTLSLSYTCHTEGSQ